MNDQSLLAKLANSNRDMTIVGKVVNVPMAPAYVTLLEANPARIGWFLGATTMTGPFLIKPTGFPTTQAIQFQITAGQSMYFGIDTYYNFVTIGIDIGSQGGALSYVVWELLFRGGC